jgi:ATPase subunit of ABC transporter with duplicated ATPase domains
MSHKPIILKRLSLIFPHKVCFNDFSVEIPYGARIAVIGRNGSGKSTLLRMIKDLVGQEAGYVPQTIEDFDAFSGGQRFNAALTQATCTGPNILLLDEPTNHLDTHHRKSLMRVLKNYPGTLIIVTHDAELLRHTIDTLWHVDQGKIHFFSGNYDDYLKKVDLERAKIEQELSRLEQEKKKIHKSLMREQKRASKSQAKGKKNIAQRKWPTIVSGAKMARGNETSAQNKAHINQKNLELSHRLSELYSPEPVLPAFSLTASDIGHKILVSVNNGSIQYHHMKPVLSGIHFSVSATERIAIMGDNGSGKSTFIKALMNDPAICKTGDWHIPKISDIGYLDQHYATLKSNETVLETVMNLRPDWHPTDARRHLNDFIFRKNEEINALVSSLSGGEKARLSLSHIAAKTPKLLILDEITNNLDIETQKYVIQAINAFPGALIVISHDQEFLIEISINTEYKCIFSCLLKSDEY